MRGVSCSFWLFALIAGWLVAPVAFAHKGGIIVQSAGGQLVTGFDNETSGTQSIGDRAFSLLFPSSLANDVPSFLSFRTPPAESEALPVGTELFWDFLPMSVDGLTSNLMYWDAIGSPGSVTFAPPPQDDLSFSLWMQNFTDMAEVTGEPEMVAGKRLGVVTGDNVALHAHRWFFMESDTTVPEGVYLVALQLRAAGYRASEPFYIAAATSTVPASLVDGLALPWIEERIDSLVVTGDYNFDGVVEAADYLVWRDQFGSGGPFPHDGGYADGNRDGIVDVRDYLVWRNNLEATGATNSLPSGAGGLVPVPEPTGCLLLPIATCAGLGLIGRAFTAVAALPSSPLPRAIRSSPGWPARTPRSYRRC